MRPLTVLQVLPALEAGGVEQGTLEVARGLVAAGHSSLVVSGGGRLVRELEAAGSFHVTWPIGKKSPVTLARWVGPLRRLLRERQVDVMDLRSRMPGWVAWCAWRSLPPGERPRLVTSVHGLYRGRLYSSVMVRGERIVAVSSAVRDYLRASYPGIPEDRVVVIPRGIDPSYWTHGHLPTDAWRHAWQAQHPELRGKLLLALPGRITALKGHADLLRVVAGLKARGVAAHALVVGATHPHKTAYRDALLRDIARFGLGADVTLTGPRADLREILSVCDAVLSLSAQPEAFGRTVLEALALGRPVVGYASGGVAELLRDLYPEGAVAPGDTDAVIQRLLQLPRTVPASPALERYTLARMVGDTIGVYGAVAAKTNGDPDA